MAFAQLYRVALHVWLAYIQGTEFEKDMTNTMLQYHLFHWCTSPLHFLSREKSKVKPELNLNAGCKECYNSRLLVLKKVISIRQIKVVRKRD
jgi:hypothetical protein